jgi:hypothetical protein
MFIIICRYSLGLDLICIRISIGNGWVPYQDPKALDRRTSFIHLWNSLYQIPIYFMRDGGLSEGIGEQGRA